MKITNEGKLGFGSLIGGLGGDPDLPPGSIPPDCCDPESGPDRALDQDAVTVSTPATGGIVQTKVGAFHGIGAGFTEDFDATPTNGNTMVAILFSGEYTGSTISTAGWTEIDSAVDNKNGKLGLWTKVAGAAEPTTVTVPVGGGGGTGRKLVLYEVGGSTDVFDSLSHQENFTPLDGPPLTATGDGVLIAAFMAYVATYAGDPTWTPQGALSTDSFDREPGRRPVVWTGHQDVVAGSYTPSLATTPLYGGWEMTAVAIVVGSTPTAAEWNVAAPNTVDGDDATYQEIDGPDVLRVDLGGPFRIVRARLLIGCEDPSNVTYSIRGANAADFSDAVNLGSVTFDSTGSFTADDIDMVWSTEASYRYFELSGPDETRRIFSLELYEPAVFLGQDHSHAAIEAEIDALAEAIDDLGAGGGFLTAIDGGGDVISTVAASGATETIDLADGNVHDITLDDDCTFTFTAVDATRARSFTLFLRQDGTGGWEATWPGTVVWAGGVAPTLSTDPDAVDVFAFVTLDGGTVWYGFPTGGGGSSVTLSDTVEDETTFGITPSAGVATDASRGDHTHGTPEEPTGGSDSFVVDAGAPTYDDSDPDEVVITVVAKFGIDGGPYFNSAGVTSGDEAALMRDPVTGTYFLRSYNF